MFRSSFLFALLLLAGFSRHAAAGPVLPPDSIGVEYRNNKVFIKHRVGAGETLYGLARRYKVPVEQIVEANPKLQSALQAGQIVLVPRQRAVLTTPAAPRTGTAGTAAPAASSAAIRALPTDASGNHIYKVAAGQTLFSIARKFGLSPQALAQLNGVEPSYNVRLGQSLIVARGTAATPRRENHASEAPATREPAVAAAPAKPAPTAPTRAERPEENDRNRDKDTATTSTAKEERGPARASEIVRRVSESGLATSITNSNTEKYLALHKTAPVGTIMQVRNIMNGQSVYVRVIGPLPDTGENSNILVRLSPRAVQRLATPDARFRVETSYVP